MSTVVDFLEVMGQDSRLRHATSCELEQALTGHGIDTELRLAILSGNQQRLEALLGATTNVCCGLHPAEEEDDAENEEGGGKDDQGDQEQKPQSALYRAAITA